MRIDLTDEKTARAVFIVGLAVVAVLVALLVAVFTGGEEEPEDEAVKPVPTSSESPSGEDPNGPPEDARQVASDAIVAYTEYSYTDDDALAWVDRLKPYATAGFIDSLNEQFGHDDPSYWQRDVVDQQRETKTTVESVEPSGMHTNGPGRWTFTVTYQTSIRKAGADWTTPKSSMSMFVTATLTQAGWKVNQIVGTGNRGDGVAS
ncbi:MAG: hypothetical protein L0H93_11795 [Nocardioides sp.]|nr:hypothetical protein [Nocardioides sp.]